MSDETSLEDALLILSVLMMREHGNKVVVSREQIHEARRLLEDNEIQVVTCAGSRLFDEVTIEFRHKSRRVLRGEVVR